MSINIEYWALAVSAASFLLFAASILSLPWLVARLPTDYFSPNRPAPPQPHPLTRILRNVIGAVLLCTGIAMLVLPGQGLLTIVVALLLLDYPGKKQLERRLVSRPAIQRGLNWLRAKRGAQPLRF